MRGSSVGVNIVISTCAADITSLNIYPIKALLINSTNSVLFMIMLEATSGCPICWSAVTKVDHVGCPDVSNTLSHVFSHECAISAQCK